MVDYAHAPAADVLPDLLNRLAVDVVPLNARVDANKLSLAQDEFRAGRAQLARIARALDNVCLGVRLDVGGEKMFVADDTGSTVPDPVMCAAMAALVFRTLSRQHGRRHRGSVAGVRAAGRAVRRPGAALPRSIRRR